MLYRTIGKGEPLVLIHGLGQTGKAWMLQEELSEHFQLFIPTLRGHGESPIKERITLQQFARDVVEMLDQEGISTAHFCGLSLGGVVVQEIHRQARKRVKSMVLANTTSYAPGLAVEMAIQNRIRSLNRFSDEAYIRQVATHSLYRPDEEQIQKAFETFCLNRETYITAARTIQGINYLPTLHTSVPIHIIASSDDKVTPYMYNAYFTKLWARRAEFTVLNQTGHLSNIQKPEQFNRVVREFVEKC